MSDTWEEALFRNMLNLIFFAVCCAIGWLVLSLLSCVLKRLTWLSLLSLGCLNVPALYYCMICAICPLFPVSVTLQCVSTD